MKKSQSKRILSYLQSGKSLTPLQALTMFGCFRLGARIWDLKEAGYKVKSKIVKSDGKHFRPLSSLTDEEKEYIVAQWLNETLDKWTNEYEVFSLIFDTCSFEDIIRFIDYVRSLNVDVEIPSLQERGVAIYE